MAYTESYQEKARTLSERFGISQTAAMKALEEADGDILGAVIRLESEGVITRTSAKYSTGTAPAPESTNIGGQASYDADNFFNKAVRLFLRGIDSSLCISRQGKELASIPVILCIIILIAAFKAAAVFVVVGLLAGCSYSFKVPPAGDDLREQ